MQTLNNVHEQFADFFNGKKLKPFTFLLSKKLSEGHICLDLKEILSDELEFPVSYQSVQEIESDLIKESLVSTKFEDKQPFILYNSQLYIQRYFVYETIILERIKDLINGELTDVNNRVELINKHREFIETLFHSDESTADLAPEEKIDWQQVAAILGVLNNFTIITGGPGTGKTTTVSKILQVLKKIYPTLTIALAAPTGKAAMRLAESLEGDKPTTIHRLLKSIKGSHRFRHNRDNPLNYDIVIIDEASMIDVALFAKLLDAIGPKTRLLLLGDKNQLASVEAGSLFRDLCQTQEKMNVLSSEKANIINSFLADNKIGQEFITEQSNHILSNHIIELKRSRRFASNKGIGRLSNAIIHNQTEDLKQFFKPWADDQVLFNMEYNQDVLASFFKGYEHYINEKDIQLAIRKLNDIRVLCAVREGEYGLYKINNLIELFLSSKGLIDPQTEFYYNRPVMITKNYYDLGLFNGDIGIIRPDSNNTLMAWFENSEKEIHAVLPALISDAETVYAMTIHKSQGSEYDKVLVVLPDGEHTRLLTRELLYTAVTRAKQNVTIMGSENTLFAIMERSVKRTSGIRERFNIDENRLWAYS